MARADFPNDEAWLQSLGINRGTNPQSPSSWTPELQARWTNHVNTLAPERQAKLTVNRPSSETDVAPVAAPVSNPADLGKFAINPETYQPTDTEKAAGTEFYRKFSDAYSPYGSKAQTRKGKKELRAAFPVLDHFEQLGEAYSAIREQLNRVPGHYSTMGDLPSTVSDQVDDAYKPKVQTLLDRAKEIRKAQGTLQSAMKPFKDVGIEPPRDPLPPSLRFDHLLTSSEDTGPKGVDGSDWAKLNPEAQKLTMDYIDAHNDFAKNNLDDQGRIRVDQNRTGINTNDPLHNTGALDKYHALHDIRQKIEKSLSVSGKKADRDAAEIQVASTLKNYPYGLIRSVDVAPRTNPVLDSVTPAPTVNWSPEENEVNARMAAILKEVNQPSTSSGAAVADTQKKPEGSHEDRAVGHIADYVNTYRSILQRVRKTPVSLTRSDMTGDERDSLIKSLRQATDQYILHTGDMKKSERMVRLKLREMPLNPEHALAKDPDLKWDTGAP
jgi:hypothetical protein